MASFHGMATLLPAIQTKWNSLTASGFAGSVRPTIYHDQAPEVASSGSQLRPPYCVVSLTTSDDILTFEDAGIEETRITFRIFDIDEGNLDSAISAVRWNGQAISSAAGFDGGTLPALTDGTLLDMLILRTPVKEFSARNLSGVNVYVATLEYLVSVER